MTDQEVVTEFTKSGKPAEIDEIVERSKRDLEEKVNSEKAFNETQRAAVLSRLIQFHDEQVRNLLSGIQDLLSQKFSIHEMRVILSFKEEYPELDKKRFEFLGEIIDVMSRWAVNYTSGSADIAVQGLRDT